MNNPEKQATLNTRHKQNQDMQYKTKTPKTKNLTTRENK
jgi:hypothetical protein